MLTMGVTGELLDDRSLIVFNCSCLVYIFTIKLNPKPLHQITPFEVANFKFSSLQVASPQTPEFLPLLSCFLSFFLSPLAHFTSLFLLPLMNFLPVIFVALCFFILLLPPYSFLSMVLPYPISVGFLRPFVSFLLPLSCLLFLLHFLSATPIFYGTPFFFIFYVKKGGGSPPEISRDRVSKSL